MDKLIEVAKAIVRESIRKGDFIQISIGNVTVSATKWYPFVEVTHA